MGFAGQIFAARVAVGLAVPSSQALSSAGQTLANGISGIYGQLNKKRVEAAKISFFLSIPTLAAVSFFGINNLLETESLRFSLTNLLSIFLSFIFSLITIKYFLKYISKFSLSVFVIYRIVLGIIILIFSYL